VANAVQSMMIDIMMYGPLTVAFDVYENFFSFNAVKEVYNQTRGSYLGGHAVKVIGWGTTSGGMPYWIIANSWNTWWGNQGYFNMLRGANLCGIESYATSVYTPSRPYAGTRSAEEPEVSDTLDVLLPIYSPGGAVTHLDLQSDYVVNAAYGAANLINQLNGGQRQDVGTPIVQSAYTSMAAGVNIDMTVDLNGLVYHVLMFEDLQGVYSFTAPPQVIGTVGGSGGLTGGDIAAIVVCSVFGAAVVVGAAVYVATRGGDETSASPTREEGQVEEEGEEKQEGRKGIPVMNPFSHIRRVQAGEHQSVTGRSNVQK
jgi:hypothetical protein